MEVIRTENKLGWTALMDHMLKLLWENGTTREDIEKCLASISLDSFMLQSLQLLASLGDNVEAHIISDANKVYIETILNSNNASKYFKSIVTNDAFYDESGRLRVTPHHSSTEPHMCQFCPANLCKGASLLRYPDVHEDVRVIYLGDGRGDFCPTKHIRNGHVLARKGWALAKWLAEEPQHTQAKIHHWENAADIFNILSGIFSVHVQQ